MKVNPAPPAGAEVQGFPTGGRELHHPVSHSSDTEILVGIHVRLQLLYKH
jgi:hypothetical protein